MLNKDIKYYISMSLGMEEDSFSEDFYNEFTGMVWSAKESSIGEDKEDWKSIDSEFRDMFILGLSMLKTYKHFAGSYCLPVLIDGVDYSYSLRKSVLATIMEKLLSTHALVATDMMTTFAAKDKMAGLQSQLMEEEKFTSLLKDLKVNTDMLSTYNIQKNLAQEGYDWVKTNENEYSLAMWKELALVALVIDTCYLLPFYVILTNAYTGRFKNTRETIQLMYRDISIATTYLTTLAAEHFQYFDSYKKLELESWIGNRIERLIDDTDFFLEMFGAKTTIRSEMREYLEYSLNKTLFKLGFTDKYTTKAMPLKIEKAMIMDFDVSRYRFSYEDPSIKSSKPAILVRKIKNILGIKII